MVCIEEIICGNRSIIGIRDYMDCDTKPESGLYLQDIPGISLKSASKVADSDYKTGVELMKSCISLGTKLVYDEFLTQISQYFNFNAIVETRVLKMFNALTIAPESKEKGLVLKRWRSEMSQIFIPEIYVKVKNSGIADLKVIDGSITTEYELDLVADAINVIRLDYKAINEQIKLVFDQTNFEVYTGSINSVSGCGSCGGTSKNFVVTGWDGEKEVPTYFGLGINASVRCYEESVFCQLIPRMYFLFWYKAGICFLKEYINSNRVNAITSFTKEEAKENLKILEAEYAKKYNVVIKSAYNFLRSTKGECITCNGNAYVQTTP